MSTKQQYLYDDDGDGSQGSRNQNAGYTSRSLTKVKRDRDFEERLQSLHIQQRASAVRALERLLKTETLKPIDQLVLLFNMHFQDREAPSFRVVSDSPLRVLHPTFFEFVAPSDWIRKWVAENIDGCSELIAELDDIISSYGAVLKSNNKRPTNPANERPTKDRIPLSKGNPDGTIGWGDDDNAVNTGVTSQDEKVSFTSLLAETSKLVVSDGDDGLEDEADVNTFWALVADCVEATQRYQMISDCFELVSQEGRQVPMINIDRLEQIASSSFSSSSQQVQNVTNSRPSGQSYVPIYGYPLALQQIEALLGGEKEEKLEDTVKRLESYKSHLAALAAVPSVVEGSADFSRDNNNNNKVPSTRFPFIGRQAQFLNNIAAANCIMRLTSYYLDSYANKERKGATDPSRPNSFVLPPIPQFAKDEAAKIKAKRLALLNQRGGASTDKDEDFIKNGFGVDYVPSESDLMRAMAQDKEAGLLGHDDLGGTGDGEDGGGEGRRKVVAAAKPTGSAVATFDEGEELFREEIHNYFVTRLQKQLQLQLGASANIQEALKSALLTPEGKPRYIKPVRYCKIKSGYVWNAYNRAKFNNGEKPPQVVQWYEFILYYPLIVNRVKSPEKLFRVEYTEKGQSDTHAILVFSAGAPYADVAYRIVNEVWDKRQGGIRCTFDDKGKLRLFFRLASTNFRR